MSKYTINTTSKCIDAISYFSSIGGSYATHTPYQDNDGEKIYASWTWWADADLKKDAFKEGYWLDLMMDDGDELTVTIYETHAPTNLMYQVMGYCKYHGHSVEVD